MPLFVKNDPSVFLSPMLCPNPHPHPRPAPTPTLTHALPPPPPSPTPCPHPHPHPCLAHAVSQVECVAWPELRNMLHPPTHPHPSTSLKYCHCHCPGGVCCEVCVRLSSAMRRYPPHLPPSILRGGRLSCGGVRAALTLSEQATPPLGLALWHRW